MPSALLRGLPSSRRALELAARPSTAFFSSTSRGAADADRPPTAVVMLNMGGPNDLEEVGPFLKNLFSDGEIITLKLDADRRRFVCTYEAEDLSYVREQEFFCLSD